MQLQSKTQEELDALSWSPKEDGSQSMLRLQEGTAPPLLADADIVPEAKRAYVALRSEWDAVDFG